MALQIAYYLLSILGIIKKKSKLLTALMMIIMWIVFGLCTYNGDYGNYSYIYKNIQTQAYWTEFEPLFSVLMYICSVSGLSFIQFRMVFSGLYIILLYITIGKYTENKAEVLGLYMLFPFLFFTSVIRSGFASVLIALAYYEIIAEKDNKIKFWILIIVATLIHYTSFFFIFYYYLRKKKFKRNSVILVVGLVGVALVAYYTGIIYQVVSMMTSSYRTLKWFMPGNSVQKPRWILYLVMIALMLVFLAYLSRRDNNRHTRNLLKINPYAEDIFYINIAMLIFIPTFFVTNASARFMWEILLLNIISYAKDDEISFPNNSIKFLRFNRKIAVLIAFLLFFMFYSNLPYRGTVNDGTLIFQNNLIYGEYSTPVTIEYPTPITWEYQNTENINSWLE